MGERTKPKPKEVRFEDAMGKFKAGGQGPFLEGIKIISKERIKFPQLSRIVPWGDNKDQDKTPDSLWIESDALGEPQGEERKVFRGGFHTSKRVGFDQEGIGIYDNFTFNIRYEESTKGKKYSAETTTWKHTAHGQIDTKKTTLTQGETDVDSFPPEEFVDLFSEFTELNAAWRQYVEDNKNAQYLAPKRTSIY